MARPVYPFELNDPDFNWLLNQFQENNESYYLIEEGNLPIVLVKFEKTSGEAILPFFGGLLDGEEVEDRE